MRDRRPGITRPTGPNTGLGDDCTRSGVEAQPLLSRDRVRRLNLSVQYFDMCLFGSKKLINYHSSAFGRLTDPRTLLASLDHVHKGCQPL